MVHGPAAGRIARSRSRREQLAKDWLSRMIERTPLAEVSELPLGWLAHEAPALIESICDAMAEPEPTRSIDPPTRSRLATLASLRDGPGAAELVIRDLAALHELLVGALAEEAHGDANHLAHSVERLAAVFGAVNGAIALELVVEHRTSANDAVTGLPGPSQLDEWLGVLLAEQRRYGHGFSLALIDVDGLGRINDAYGRDAGDRMLVAVAAILRRQLREVDQAFRLEEDEFAVVAPHTEAPSLVALATRVAGVIARSQEADGPLIAIAAGVVACPADGLSAERLLESAAEATYAAKASGAPVAMSPKGAESVLQDP